MSIQAQVEQGKKPLVGWKSKVWLFVILFLAGYEFVRHAFGEGSMDEHVLLTAIRLAYILLSLGLAHILIKWGKSSFFTLVRNDMNSIFQKKRTLWALAIGLSIIFYVLNYLDGRFGIGWRVNLPPDTLQGYLFIILLLGIGYYFVKKEWKDKTASWWLTLPYSKEQLIVSKFIAIGLRFLQVWILASLINAIWVVIFFPSDAHVRLIDVADSYLFTVSIIVEYFFEFGIASLILGMIIALMSESVFKKYYLLVALLAIVFSFYQYRIYAALVYYSTYNPFTHESIALNFLWHSLDEILVASLFSYLFYRFAVYISKKKIEA